MTSYASVDSIEDGIVVFEVELLPYEDSRTEDFATKDTARMEVSLLHLPDAIIKEGDILVVEHDGKNIDGFYYKDEEERKRRLEVVRKLYGL